jgi:membrane protein YdbS with pleckstrin-like domain
MITITEKTYPIENKWIIKTTVDLARYSLLILAGSVTYVLLGKLSIIDVIALIIIFIILGLILFVIFLLQRRNFHYSLDDKFITLHQGILSKQQRNIPYGVIQNVFVKQDLLDRIFGIALLAIENASQGGGSQGVDTVKAFGIPLGKRRQNEADFIGFSGNKINIPGLSMQNAESLKASILQKMQENPVEDSRSGL